MLSSVCLFLVLEPNEANPQETVYEDLGKSAPDISSSADSFTKRWDLSNTVAGLACPCRTQLASPRWAATPPFLGSIQPWGTRSLHQGSVTPTGRQPSHGGRRWGKQRSHRTKAEKRWRGPFWLCSSHLEGMTTRASVPHVRRCIDRHSSGRANESQLANDPALSTGPSHWAACFSLVVERNL